jgi:hypothetical protein|tara:strand:- start:21141 stop:21335 length:195 start_codon:yes stop_codon:yes gene_type:complete
MSAYKKPKYRDGGSLLSRMTQMGNLDMTMPNKAKNSDCGCGSKPRRKMNMGGTVPTANTYHGKK